MLILGIYGILGLLVKYTISITDDKVSIAVI